LVNALYDAAREMAEDTNYFPTHIYCAPGVWEKLGLQLDSQNRPVFGYVGANNNISQNGLGGNTGGLDELATGGFGHKASCGNGVGCAR
jgi:hypothetical protein